MRLVLNAGHHIPQKVAEKVGGEKCPPCKPRPLVGEKQEHELDYPDEDSHCFDQGQDCLLELKINICVVIRL